MIPFFFLSCLVMSDSLRLHGLYSPWNSPGQNTGVGSLSLEKEMATHSSILVKRILWTEEPGGLPSMRSHRARHDWSNLAAAAAAASPALQVDSLPTELSGKPIFFMIISTFFLCWYFGYKPSLYLLNTVIFLFGLDFFASVFISCVC